MQSHVLQLDIQGTPQAWISIEQAALCYATGSVAWEEGAGPLAVLRGGWNVQSQRQSLLAVNPIIAVRGQARVNLFDLVPGVTKAKLFRRDRFSCAYCGTTAPLAFPRPPMGSTLNPLFAVLPSSPQNNVAYHRNIAYLDTAYVLTDWYPTFIPVRGTPQPAMTGYPDSCVHGAYAFPASATPIPGWGAVLVFGGDGIGGGPGC